MLQFAIALNEWHLNCWPQCLYNFEWGIKSLLSTKILWFCLNWIIPIVTARLRIQLNHESQKWWNPSTSESLVSLIRVDNTRLGLHTGELGLECRPTPSKLVVGRPKLLFVLFYYYTFYYQVSNGINTSWR